MGERLRSLETNRAALIGRQRAIQPFRDNPPGYFRVLLAASDNPVVLRRYRLEMVLFALVGAFIGLLGAAIQILFSEFMDNRIKTRADVRRVTGLPLLATLGDLRKMSPGNRDQWAFRAWTALQSKLSISPNHGMVCGITSANSSDGRSTWVGLLASAASACGFRVLTITAQPSEELAMEVARRENRPPPSLPQGSPEPGTSLTTSVLSSPAQIVEKLTSAECPPVVSIPLPGWVWNLERRKQWQSALEAWREVENIVIFVELPPASVAESVLLAENIPNLLWLADSNKSDAEHTLAGLETLRDASCNLVGAVLNRERAAPVRGQFSRWLGNAALLLALGIGLGIPAAAHAAVEPEPGASFSAGVPAKRESWQEHLTLGPGDVLTFHLYGSPELTREDQVIGPDGRVSYLEADNVAAAGLTVDELRDRLNSELGKFRRAPQVYVTPVSYRSKKYYMMGTVVLKGVFYLDRPITVIEAVARARGFETGISAGDTIEATDFSRSFISRNGHKLPVDLEKLFLHGDLSQNIKLEPNDYLFFPAVVLRRDLRPRRGGRAPGPVPYDSGMSVLAAIASRGGFAARAWKAHVLVVRGSLDHPTAYKVDISGALTGDAPNMALQPGDLVYVSNRPWYRAEELLDRAAQAFTESAVVTWTGLNVGPGIIAKRRRLAMKTPSRRLDPAARGPRLLLGLRDPADGPAGDPRRRLPPRRPLPSQAWTPPCLQPSDTAFLIGPGDHLEIEVMGDPASRSNVAVGPDGRIYYNILPGLDVWGLTLPQARERIESEMKKFLREKPVVAVTLRSAESQQVWILGRLGNPGVYPLGHPTTLLEAVAQAGGLGVSTPVGGAPIETADLSRSFLIRQGRMLPVDFDRLLRDGDLSQNVYLQPDDFIFVPSLRSAQVHIRGAVLQPRSERMCRGH